jgi:hypothetical protein
MTFKEAYEALKSGSAIRRATWLGYWIAYGENVLMHSKDGEVYSMKDGCIPMFTLSNCVADDWVVVDDAHRSELDKIHAAKILMPAADQQKAAAILASR